jgi:hypothetical protein
MKAAPTMISFSGDYLPDCRGSNTVAHSLRNQCPCIRRRSHISRCDCEDEHLPFQLWGPRRALATSPRHLGQLWIWKKGREVVKVG